MQCPSCGTMNPAQSRFCMGCGRMLVNGIVCQTCHTLLPPDAHYCFHCGAMIISPVVDPYTGQVMQPVSVPATPPSATVSRPQVAPPPAVTPSSTAEKIVQPPAYPTAQLPPPRSRQELLPSLKRLLPEALYEPLERRPTEQHLIQAKERLAKLLSNMKTYLPWPVIAAPQPAGEPAGGMYRGVFLFGDVSGFTPLSEQLKKLGQAGAERIAEIINDLFNDLVGVLSAHGGILLKFGGDALLGVFPAGSDDELSVAALRAVQAAMTMQEKMVKFSAIEAGGETRALQIKCGISSGEYFAAHIGTKPQPEIGQNGTMAYVTTGHTVNRAELAEEHANPGDVVITQDTLDLLGDKIEFAPVEKEPDESFHRVLKVPPVEGDIPGLALDEPPDGELQAQTTYLVDRLERLAPYLPDELVSRIVTSPGDVVEIAPDRRRVTAMFVNYLGISDLIQALGHTHPELITQHLNDYFVHMAEVVERYEGTLARMDQYAVGDRLVIFFGAPRAHEDDPLRAVYTALDMQRAVRKNFKALQTPEGIFRFQQRVGINTGTLFAGNCGAVDRQEYTLMGDDINMAARLMSKAEFQTIFISKGTQEYVTAYCDLKDRGALKVKGKEILIPTFEVLGRRKEIGRTRGLGVETPTIGRAEALQSLKAVTDTLKTGSGRITAIVGDSGLGKSRLLRDFRTELFGQNGNNLRWLKGQALSFSEQVSYWLAAQLVRDALDLESDADEDDVLYALWDQGEELLGKDVAREAIPFLAYLLNLELKGEWAAWVRDLDPKARQKQTSWAAQEFFTAAARKQPMVIAIDDLHFADEASLVLLEDLLEVAVNAPLVFCLVFRPLRDKGCWRLRNTAANKYPHRYTEVMLEPLDDAESRHLFSKLLPGIEFPPQTLGKIFEKSAGNPFYLEEVVRSLIDGGAVVKDEIGNWKATAKIEQIAVPDTLQGAIISRIDRLTDDARLALQMAAVIGRRFQLEILRSLAQAETELGKLLAQLERSDLIQPEASEAAYVFPDALVQEVAYDNLLHQRRQQFHRQVGMTLEEILSSRGGEAALEQECELLAYHFSRGDDPERAMKYLEMAGHKSQAGFANETALQQYTDLLVMLGSRPELWEKRFSVLFHRQQIFGLVGNPTARNADLETMMKLAEEHNDDACRSDALNELADLCQWSSKYEEAKAAAEQARDIKTASNDQAGRATALHTLGVLAYYRGNYDEARPLLEEAIQLRQAVKDAKGEAWSAMYLGMIYFMQGNFSEALKHHQHAYQVAQTRQDMFQTGIHLTNLSRALMSLGEYQQALDMFQQSLEMKRRVGDRMGQGFSLFGMGLALVYLGRYGEAEVTLQDSLTLRREMNDERGISYCLHGLGLAAFWQEKSAQVEEYFQQAYDLRVKLGLKAETIESLSFLGQARLKLGKLPEAAEDSARAMELLEKQGNVPEVQQIFLNHYRILAAQNDALAGDFLQKACSTVQIQAEQIGDSGRRQTFLEKVWVNREIAAIA